MSLLDALTGMRGGPMGGGFGGGGMSPLTMGLLGLLAYKAVKGFNNPDVAGARARAPGGVTAGDSAGGGLGNFLKILGGSGPGKGGLGGILSGGLGDLLKQFQSAGKADVADSWVGTGENKPITPADLGTVLTPEQIAFLTQHTGLSRDALLQGLSQQLPKAIDDLTPAGRPPSHEDIARLI
jgi:uncharacterized protein YidB (DUF937 family)